MKTEAHRTMTMVLVVDEKQFAEIAWKQGVCREPFNGHQILCCRDGNALIELTILKKKFSALKHDLKGFIGKLHGLVSR